MLDLIPQYEQSLAFLERRIRDLTMLRAGIRPLSSDYDMISQRIIRLETEAGDLRYAIAQMKQGTRCAASVAAGV